MSLPIARRTSLALLLNALIFAVLALLLSGREALWAMRALTDLPWPARIILVALPFAALLPPAVEWVSCALERAIGWLARAPRAVGAALLIASGLLFWLLRERTLWGDALYTLALLEGRWRTTWRGEYFWKEPLDRLLVVAVYQITHALVGWDAWRAIALVSCLAGVAYVWIAWRLAGEMADDALRRGLAFALLLSPGAMQLFFGHVENYTLVTATALGYMWLALQTLHGRRHPVWAAGTLGLAIAFHPQAVFLAPSLAVLLGSVCNPLRSAAEPGRDGPPTARQRYPFEIACPALRLVLRQVFWLAIGLAVPLLILFGLAQAIGAPPLQIGVNRFADDTRLWLSAREMLSPGHLLDVFNNLYLVAPSVIAAALLLAIGWRSQGRSGTFWGTSTLGVLAYSLAFDNKLPRPDDWDLFAIASVPVTAWTAHMVAQATPALARRVGVALLTSSLCLTTPWVWSNHAYQRVELNPAKVDLLAIYRVHDLIAEFSQAQVQHPPQPLCEAEPGEDPTICQYVAITRFTMPQNGDTRPVMVTHPPAQVSYRLRLPDQPAFLWLSLALDPVTWGWGGDGATFVLAIDDGGGPSVAFQRHIGNGPEDQRWHDVTVDLTPWRGREVTLTFSAEPGPANDYTGDRGGWGLMQLMIGKPRLADQG
ncbi:MAG: hypothetical protein RML36_14185 [Anaerolineae bacterium]|nr:hypothetical protein [Anaerolineae bacterium]MDW8100625.1 hypothetical protein [Anaerolineae bacterium]